MAFWDNHTQTDLGENWPLFVIPLVKQLIPIIIMTVFFLASMVRVPQVAQDAENRIRKRTPSPQNPLPWSMVSCAQVVANALPNGCQLSASCLTPGNQTHASKLNDNGLERSRGTKGSKGTGPQATQCFLPFRAPYVPSEHQKDSEFNKQNT